ncbi:MAG: hypothetical protein RJB66_1004 [Pseudomonadota bacterium]|jgi:hypothetical protein
MRAITFFLLFLFATLLTANCRRKNEFPSQLIEKEPGAITVLNSDGFIGSTVVGNQIETTITLFASGGLDTYDLNIQIVTTDPFSFAGGSYPGTGGTCGTIIESGDTCTIVILYEPQSTTTHRATLAINYRDSIEARALTFPISADSHPILVFNYGNTYDFGNKFIGSSTDLRIQISNAGRSKAETIALNNIVLPYSYKGGTFPGSGGNCQLEIIPGETCSIVVNYSPSASGRHSQQITFSYTNNGRPEKSTLKLSAWGFNKAVLSLQSESGDDNFGTRANGYSNRKTYTLRHTAGDVAANVISVANLQAPFSRVGGTCGTSLSIDQGTCTIILEMNSHTSGAWQNSVIFSYHNGIDLVSSIRTLTGSTKQKPELSFSILDNLDFGIVNTGQSRQINLTITYLSGELPATNLTLSGLSTPYSKLASSNCGASLASGQCQYDFIYNPTSRGTNNTSVDFSFNDGSTTQKKTFSFRGATQSNLTANSLSFPNTLVGNTTSGSVDLTFSGGANITYLSHEFIQDPNDAPMANPFVFAGNTYPGTGGTCNPTINGPCRISIAFKPLSALRYRFRLKLHYHDGITNSSFEIPIEGTGSAAAQLTMSNASFSNTPINSFSSTEVTVTNSSSLTATSLNPILPPNVFIKNGTFPGSGRYCKSSLPGNSTCVLALLFYPASDSSYQNSITLNYFDGSQNRTSSVSVPGMGIKTSHAYISPEGTYLDNSDGYNYNSVYLGASKTVNLKIGYGGNASTATIQSMTTNNTQFVVTNLTCSANLTLNDTCLVAVAYTPNSTSVSNAVFTVNYTSEGISRTASRSLLGTGQSSGSLTLSPASINFGTTGVGAQKDQIITVTRSGAYPVGSFSSAISGTGFIYKGGTYPGTGGTCPTFAEGTNSCKIVISFNPTQQNTFSGQLSLSYYNGFQNSLASAEMTGESVPSAKLVFETTNYHWGQLIQTLSSDKTIRITNNGSQSATSISAATLTNSFSYKGGTFPGSGGSCTDTLAPLQSCSLVVTFSPTAVGIKNTNLVLNYLDGLTSTNTTTSLTGEGIAQAIISLSEVNPYNFGAINSGGSLHKLFILTNAGSVTGTQLAGSFTSAFGFRGGQFPGSGGNCGSTLAPGTTCTIELSFTPSVQGNYIGSFTLNYNDGLGAQTEYKELHASGN